MFKNLILVLSVLLFCQPTVDASVSKFTPVKRDSLYKTLVPRQLERTTTLQGLTIVVPDEQAWKDLGQQIANALKSKWNLAITVSTPDANKFSTGWTGNTLILGNLANNKQMARLYGLYLSYADAIYPGKGGYQLLTIIDPFGLGGNTITVSASDIKGGRLGVDRLIEIIKKEKTPVIPWLLEAKLPKETTGYFTGYNPSPDASEIARYTRNAKKLISELKPLINDEPSKNVLLKLRSRIITYGEYYELTGNIAFAEMYKQLLLGYTRFLNAYPVESEDQLVRRNMWTAGDKVFHLWTVLEASPLFSDSERREILSALYLTYEANSKDPYLKSAEKVGARWNHQIFPAISLVGTSYYFEKYFKIPEASNWGERGHRIFTGNTSIVGLDEGSDYMVHVPMIVINYSMLTGKLKYMNRVLRPSADLNSMMIDNLGTMSGGGDTYPFGRSSAYSWGHSQVMNAASWYFNDPIYNFLLKRTKDGPFPGQGMSDLKYPIHRYTVDHNQIKEFSETQYPKVQALEVEPATYADRRVTQKINVDQPHSFHKLTFRSGFGLDDSYLILDGLSTGTHGHEDGNAILNYSANGRLFLVDRDYIQKTPEYHSGIVIVKDGEQFIKPAFAKLEWVADVEGTSISRSKVSEYNDTDWDRTIINPAGKFYIIYDDLKINKPGNFIFKNLWQSLGTPQIHENTFRIEQKGVMMLIQSMAKADLRLKDIYGHFIKYWKIGYPYAYADHETVLTEVIEEKEYKAGDHAGFINILSSHKENTYAVQAMRINENTMEISDGELTWFAVKGRMNSDIFNSDGTFHLLGNNELIATAVRHIKVGSKELRFSMPVFFKMNTLTGEWKTYSLLKDKIKYDEQGNPIEQGILESGTLNWNKSLLQGLEQSIRGKDKIQNIPQKPASPESTKGWKKIFALNEQITSSAFGDINGDGKDELLLAGINGTVKAIDADGKEIWKFTAQGRINEISVQPSGNAPLIFIATENWYVHALDAEGKELWKRKLPNSGKYRESKGNLLGITNVRLAYLNGKDKEPSIMVGTQFRYLYELNLLGKIRSHSVFYYYGLEDMEFADFDGDGKDEGVIGLEYYSYSFIKGKKITNSKRGGGPGWNNVEVLDREGKKGLPSALIGSKEREVRLLQFEKDRMEHKWIRNVGGVVNVIRQGDFNNDGVDEILVGSEGFQFYVLNPEGGIVFRKSLGDRVLKVDGLRNKGKAGYLAATAEGKLYKFSDSGNLEQSSQFSDGISNILISDNNSLPFIILENGDIYRMN